jgi:hypothetical protein
MAGHRTYRALTLLYPKTFRAHYREDLVQHHGDLVRERGPAGAWLRSGFDLIITVPVYQLESIMSGRPATPALNLIVGVLGASGIAVFLLGLPVGAVLLAVAIIIGLTQRSELARGLRRATPAQRRHRFAASALLAVSAGAVLLVAFNDEQWGDGGAVIYTVSFLALAMGSVRCLLIALAGRPPIRGSIAG